MWFLWASWALLRGSPAGYERHGQWIADEFGWLESDTDARAARWAAGEDAATQAHLHRLPEHEALVSRVAELLDGDSTSPPRKYGDRSFFVRQRSGEEKPTFLFEEGGKEVVVVDAVKVAGRVSVFQASWDGLKVAYRQHPHSNDAAFLVVLDLAAPGFPLLANLSGARYASPSWGPNSTGFFYTSLPPLPSGMPESEWPGLQTVVYYNVANKSSRVIVEPSHDPQRFVSTSVTRDGRYLVRSESAGWSRTRLDVRPVDGEGWEPLYTGDGNAGAMHFAGTFFVYEASALVPRGRMLAGPEGGGEAGLAELVPEAADVLDGVELVGGLLALHYLHDVRPYVELYSPKGELVRSLGLPVDSANARLAHPTSTKSALAPVADGRGLGYLSGFSGDPNRTTVYFVASSPLHPPAIFRLELPDGEPELWFQQQVAAYDPQGVVAEQEMVPGESPDGPVEIPVTLIRPAGAAKPRRAWLMGYGGFSVTLYPRFSPTALAWVERGGVYAVANLRGGGEYGRDWHQQGRGLRKHHVFEDFSAVAGWLARQHSAPHLIAAEGGSNGGLLVGAALVQHPEQFGAVVCRVPLLDMVKYTEFDSGRTWIPEYGDPANATEFTNLLGYSPYHHVAARAAQPYPPTLLMSTHADDRVSPMHARKFVARLKANGQPAWLRVEAGGHSGTADRRARAESEADAFAFALHHLVDRHPVGQLRGFGSHS